ncbi:hypothetical protein EBZ80_01925 [bacterium]|nr:hypothetical protein [bacterium]
MNIGKVWTKEEDERLMDEIREKHDVQHIAREHGRTPKAIEMRVEGLIRRFHKDRRYPVSSLADLFHRSEQEIRQILEQSPQQQQRPVSLESIQRRLDDMEDLLRRINKKLSREKKAA